MRQLDIDLSELAFALESGHQGMRHYLDLETGQVVAASDDTRRFKDVLLRYPHERERWFAFQEARMRQRIGE